MRFSIYSWLLLAGAISVFIVYLVVLFKYAVNVPRYDDFELFLTYLISFDNNIYFDNRMLLTFAQHNEHRPVIERLIALAQWSFFKRLNFAHLIYIGSLMLVLSTMVLFRAYRKKIPKTVLLFLIGCVFFNLNSWENTFWSTGALQNYTGLFLCLISFVFAIQDKGKWWFLAYLFAVLSMLTGGLGLFAFITILVYYSVIEKKYWISLFFLLLSIIPFYLYFNHYVSNPGHADARFWITHYPMDVFNYFIVFLGNFTVGLGIRQLFWTQLAGYTLLVFSVYAFIRYRRVTPISLMVISLVLLSALAAALGRVNFTYIQAMSSRYQILSLLLLFIFVVEVVYPMFKQKRIAWTIPIVFVVFYLGSFRHNYKYIVNLKYDLQKSAYCHYVREEANDYQHPAIFYHPRGILNESSIHKIYFTPHYTGSFQCK